MKKIFSTFLIFVILFSNITFVSAGETCNYSSQIEECKQANINGSPRSIEDFLCISEIDNEKMIYNLILDDKFKKIDKEADKDLDDLQKNKNLFFGKDKQENYLQGVHKIYKLFGVGGEFEQKYREALTGVISETISCLNGNKTSIDKVKNYFSDNAIVNKLIANKNLARQKVAIDILTLNKQQIRKDSSKKFMQVRRTRYDAVSNLFMINLGYLMRIMFKWPSKTKNPY